jgi:hypothetical protein
MDTEEPKTGHSSGWSVDEDPEDGFKWTAHGPTGTRHGHAENREEAERAALEAEHELIEEASRLRHS